MNVDFMALRFFLQEFGLTSVETFTDRLRIQNTFYSKWSMSLMVLRLRIFHGKLNMLRYKKGSKKQKSFLH